MTPQKRNPRRKSDSGGPDPPAGVRIIGGRLRGRKLHYSGDPRTRPMKDRVREAVFNLVGPSVRGKHAIDLFAGSGALGLEALSRGADRATLIERHIPTARDISRSAADLGEGDRVQVVAANTFIWARRPLDPGPAPWLIFCCPPYAFYVERTEAMLQLIATLLEAAPDESVAVVEADERFAFSQLPDAVRWDVRPYPPAVVGIYRKHVAVGDAEPTNR
ncbi:MAG: RsmD family RNA methyltransferase [Thermoguttaceae bacterium]